MNLLLLLSALLSALTGAVGGAQRLESAPTLARSLEQSAVRAAATIAPTRPVAAVPVLTVIARAAVETRAFAVSRVRLWQDRRRE